MAKETFVALCESICYVVLFYKKAHCFMIKVSIIVPVYNAGERIYKCLDTLVNQTLREIEIICVLDCPTDGTDKVVEEYAMRDERIVIVRNERNLHVSGSRNEGLKVARGEYIGFSDHDDYRDLRMYELLYAKACVTKSDIVVSGSTVIHENGNVAIELCQDKTRSGAIESVIMPWEYYQVNKNRVIKNIWGNIYKRKFLHDNALRFYSWQETLEEDVLFNSEAYVLANDIGFVEGPLYTWHKKADSAGNTWVEDKELVDKLVRRQLFQTEKVVEVLMRKNELKFNHKPLQILLSHYMHVYCMYYRLMTETDRLRLSRLLSFVKFPLFGRYDLKLLSKKRVQLLFFVLRTKYFV